METNKFFPMFVDISPKKIKIFGGGKIAERRILTLLSFAKDITVIAPDILPELEELYRQGRIGWERKCYEREDLYDADMVLATTNDAMVNGDIYSACKCLGILVNHAGDQKKCDFQFPGILCHEDVVMGFNGGGKAHKKTREMRKKVERLLERGEACDED